MTALRPPEPGSRRAAAGSAPDAELAADAHVRVREGLEDLLEKIRARWKAEKLLVAYLKALEALPAGAVSDEHREAAEALRPEGRHKSPEAEWLAIAERELDDDEIAEILGLSGDRQERLAKVRRRRSHMRKPEKEELQQLIADLEALEGGSG